MRRRPEAFLWDAIQACRKVVRFSHNLTPDALNADEVLQSALPFELMKIGEALNMARRDFPELAHAIPDLPRIIDQRNFLAHVYFAIDYERILVTSQTHVPALLEVLESLWETYRSDYEGVDQAWDGDARG